MGDGTPEQSARAAGGAYIPTVFVGLYAPSGDAAQHCAHRQDQRADLFFRSVALPSNSAGGAYVLKVLVGMYAPLADASRHCVLDQEQGAIPEQPVAQTRFSSASLRLFLSVRGR
jgi:hypothetical protein